MEYNIVTNFKIIQELKKYPNYKVSLGYSATVAQPDNSRAYRETDKFAFFYNKRYKTTIFGQGYIGDISFYTDHYIKDDQLAIYFDKEEFVFDFDWDLYKEKGIEWYLGYLLKDIEFKLEQERLKKEREEREKETEDTQVPVGNPFKLVPGHPQYSPGNVTFDDIKAYQEAKRTGLIK